MSMRRHLLIVTPGFPGHDDETDCIPALQVFLEAVRRLEPELELLVAALHYPRRTGEYSWRGLSVLPLNLPKSRLLRLAALRTAPTRLTSWLEEVDVGGVHSFWLNDSSLLAGRVSRRLGVPHLCTVMGQDVLPGNRYLRLATRAASRHGLGLVAPSERALEALRASSGIEWEEAYLIPWGVERLPGEARPWSERDVDVLGVGSLSELKRFDLFVDVVAELRSRGIAIRCEILGEGPARSKLRRRISSLDLDGSVVLRGALPREEVLARMERAKVLLHTSRFEGFGLVFAEALAAGMSVVSTPVGWAHAGHRWRLGSDRAELAQGIEHMLQTPVEPPVRQAPWSRDTAERYLEIYRQLTID